MQQCPLGVIILQVLCVVPASPSSKVVYGGDPLGNSSYQRNWIRLANRDLFLSSEHSFFSLEFHFLHIFVVPRNLFEISIGVQQHPYT